MNRTILSLLVLLLFGLFSQPSTAQSRQQLSQQQAEEKVAKMSEAEMRTYLPYAEAMQKKYQSALKTGNYGVGDDAISQGVAKAAAEAFYYYYTAAINAIKKRLSKIDSQKPKPQTEQQQPEPQTEQQQQEIPGRTSEQVQADLQQSYEKNLEETQARYNQTHKMVDANADAAKHGSEALDLVSRNKGTNFEPVTEDMLDKQQLTRSNSRPNISDKFQKPKSEEPKEEVSEEDDAERRRLLIEKLQSL